MSRDIVIERALPLDERQAETSAAKVRDLLGNYCNLNHAEREDLIASYQSLTPLEIALLRSDEALAENLNYFRADHPKVFRTPVGQYAALIWVPLLGVLVCFYAVVFRS